MSVSGVSAGSSDPYAAQRVNRREQFMQRLQGDNSQSAQSVKSDFAKVAADLQSGDSSALQTDGQALHKDLQAYRHANAQASGQTASSGHVHGHHHPHHHPHGQSGLSATDPTSADQDPFGASATGTSSDPLQAWLAQLQSPAIDYTPSTSSISALFSAQA